MAYSRTRYSTAALPARGHGDMTLEAKGLGTNAEARVRSIAWHVYSSVPLVWRILSNYP